MFCSQAYYTAPLCAPSRVRLLIKHGIWELYLDDLYVQTYITGTSNGQLGFFAKSGDVEFTDLRCWEMTPDWATK